MVAHEYAENGEMTNPFPAGIPADIDDPGLIAANDWAAFESVGEMVNHWERPGWHPGRRSYLWILSFTENVDLSTIAQECFQACSAHAFDQVPLDALHLTVRRVGFTDEIDEDSLEAIFTRAESLCAKIESFPLNAGPLAASRGAVRFSVAPWSVLFEIYDAVGVASQLVTGRGSPSARETFRPHISIAYSRTRQEAKTLRQSVARYRALPPIGFKVSRVELVELRRESAAYRWNVIRGVDLALNRADRRRDA
jgi:2'-5' RNA ligase